MASTAAADSYASRGRLQAQLGVEGLLVGVGDAGEVRDSPCECLGVQTLRIVPLALRSNA